MTTPISKWTLLRTFALAAVVFFLLAATNTAGDSTEIETEEAHRISESALKSLAKDLPKNLVDPKFSYGKRKRFRGPAADRTVLISQQAVYRTVAAEKENRSSLGNPSGC